MDRKGGHHYKGISSIEHGIPPHEKLYQGVIYLLGTLTVRQKTNNEKCKSKSLCLLHIPSPLPSQKQSYRSHGTFLDNHIED